MPVPVKRVEIQVDENAAILPFFTLDDPVLGILDDPTGESILGSLSYVDVTPHVVQISTNRGASRQLDRFNAGQCSVVFDNTQRLFDPLGTSPYSQQLLPRRGIRVYSDDVFVFEGIVDDWNLNYNPDGNNLATAESSDRFSLLANQALMAGTLIAANSGDRINSVLNNSAVQWPGDKRDIDTGQVFLQQDLLDEDTNVLDYLNLVSQTELGNIFITKDGDFRFQDSGVGPNSSNLLTFADDGTGIPFNDLQVIYGSELLYNRIVLTRENGDPQIAEDLTSQSFYGISTYSQDGLLMDLDSQALANAEYLLSQYANPEYRFESLTVELSELSEAQQALILSKELTDVVEVKFTPNGIGDPIDRFNQIIGISHNIQNFSHTVTFNFRTLEFGPFVLDDPIFGVLSGDISEQTYEESGLTYDGDLTYNGDIITIEGYRLG